MKTVLILSPLPLSPTPNPHRPLCRSPPIPGFLDDYAFVVCGLLDLYESSLQTQWLQWAEELQLRQDELFWDEQGGGYFCSDPADGSVLLQLKEGEQGFLCVPPPTPPRPLWLRFTASLTLSPSRACQ